MKKNAVVGQSGGPTAVINASLYGTVYEALNREDEICLLYTSETEKIGRMILETGGLSE